MQAMGNHPLTGKNPGNYHIDRLLGQGPLSYFYEAHSSSGQRVMLTSFSLTDTSSAQTRDHFLTHFKLEGARLTRLKHPAIIPIYDSGEYGGSPYLITPFTPGSSLVQILRSQGRFSIEATLSILRKVADALDYAHLHGVLHGSLSTANIVQKSEDTLQIAGFGFMHILARQHLEQRDGSDAEILQNAQLFAGTSGRMAPELMAVATEQRVSFDARIDTYALGILLFELVSGHLPFTGKTPSESVQQQVQPPIPSLAALDPTLPATIDTVLQKALAYQPKQRFQSAGELMHALEQALDKYCENAIVPSSLPHHAKNAETIWATTTTLDDKEEKTTGHHSAPPSDPKLTQARSNNQIPQQNVASDFDPFVWWANVSSQQTVPHPKTVKIALDAPQKVQRHKQDRRKVVALLTGSGIVALIGLSGGTIALAHILHNHTEQTQTTSTLPQNSAPPHSTKSQSPAPTTQPQSGPRASAGAAPTQTPPPPAPTPTPLLQHMGTVIGATSLPSNSAQSFTNIARGNASLLIHLPNGKFVAYSRSCTHQGVPVNYDPGSHQLVCPAHGAVFDPANNAIPVSGPATTPLAAVAIHVNGDGTITVGE